MGEVLVYALEKSNAFSDFPVYRQYWTCKFMFWKMFGRSEYWKAEAVELEKIAIRWLSNSIYWF
jgi:hypothetical protein